MAGRLESMLQPGEQLVYQARLGISGFLRRWLSATAFIAALDLSLRWLTVEVPPGSIWSGAYTLSPVFLVAMMLLYAYILLALGEALVTNRRLLRRRGLVRRRIDELALSEVKRVHGIESGSPRSVQVENVDGVLLTLDELPGARHIGRAVAQAAGLPMPTSSAPIAERAAKVLILYGMYGPILGFCVTVLGLLSIASLDRSDPLGLLGFALVVTMIVPGAFGVVVGWILGSLLAILYLRPMVTAEEIRNAIYVDLGSRDTILQTDDFRHLGRGTLLRLASLVYGQRIAPLEDRSQKHVT